MKKIVIALFAVSLLVLSGTAFAVEEVKAVEVAPKASAKATPQQNRMKVCAEEYHAKKLEKSQYRAFISKCLRGEEFNPAEKEVAPSAMHNKIKDCAAKATTKKLIGSARKAFMKDCLAK